MNKGNDWHGQRESLVALSDKVWIGDRLIKDRLAADGAWPKPVFPEPPCGWAERDALV